MTEQRIEADIAIIGGGGAGVARFIGTAHRPD